MDPMRFFKDDENNSDPESKPVPGLKQEPQGEGESPSPWDSMKARRRDPSEPMDEIEARLAKVYKKNHSMNAPEDSGKTKMIGTDSICQKCLLFKSVCKAIGRHVEDT